MKKYTEFKGIQVCYTIEGEGDALIFLHGYLESKEIWSKFADRFVSAYRVICVDLPGHGESGSFKNINEMDDLAASVSAVMENENIGMATLVGHSMGGYAVVSFAHLFQEKLKGYCLFHSTCFADNEEKKNNRDREIGLVMCGKKTQIVRTNIPKAFADDNIERMSEEVDRAREIAMKAPEDGVVALLRGMKSRKDHSSVLQRAAPVPLLVRGMKDNYIPAAAYEKMIMLAPHAKVITLKNSGHLGFIEEPEQAYQEMLDYLRSIQ